MADDIEEGFDISVIREAIYGNAFSEGTEKSGRNLLLVATVTLVTAVFEVAVKSTPLVPLDFSKQPDSLITFLAIANIALLINYTLKASNDLFRAREDWANARKFIQIERIRRAHLSAKETEKQILSAQPHPDEFDLSPEPWWEEYHEVEEEGRTLIRNIEAGISNRRLPIIVRWIRLVFFGGLPVLTGLAALIHTWKTVLNFFLAVLGL